MVGAHNESIVLACAKHKVCTRQHTYLGALAAEGGNYTTQRHAADPNWAAPWYP